MRKSVARGACANRFSIYINPISARPDALLRNCLNAISGEVRTARNDLKKCIKCGQCIAHCNSINREEGKGGKSNGQLKNKRHCGKRARRLYYFTGAKLANIRITTLCYLKEYSA